MVIHSGRKPPDRRFLDSASAPRNDGGGVAAQCLTPTGKDSPRVSYCGDTQWLIIPAGNFIPVRFDSDSLSFSTA